MNTAGSKLWGHATNRVYEFTDVTASVGTLLHTFTGIPGLQGVRIMPDGELLVSTDNDTALPGALWRSTNYPTLGASATWAKVLDAQSDASSFSHVWGMHQYGNIVVVCEYGGKTPPKASSKAYLSEDGGLTWREIYDAGQLSSNLHMHGAAYDHWWDRMWLVQGDSPNQKVLYSDDWRNVTPTWTTAYTTKLHLGVVPLENAICFTTDDAPCGVYRLPRTGYRTMGSMELVYQIDATMTHLGMQTFHRGDGYPALFSFRVTPDGTNDSGILIASMDGSTFHELWQDTSTYQGGLYRIMGPTTAGKLIGTLNNGAYQTATFTAPTWAKN